MRELPMIFSTPMVKAKIDGRKTVTRRLNNLEEINERPDEWKFVQYVGRVGDPRIFAMFMDGDETLMVPCPWNVGDWLYTRENYYDYGYWEPSGQFTKTGKRKWHFVSLSGVSFPVLFNEPMTVIKGRPDTKIGYYKRLARFMPKKFARIWDEVVSVRVERLQDITEEDAIAEGINPFGEPNPIVGGTTYPGQYYENYAPVGYSFMKPIDSFRTLWQSINGPGSWEANPFVWRIEYKNLSTTGRPKI